MSHPEFDVAVVGAGILGLAHTLAASRRGLRVLLIDRTKEPRGASVRNFGMVWPIGQPAGRLEERALRSRVTWLELAREVGFWIDPCGSLHVAQHEDEERVLHEYVAASPNPRGRRFVTAREALRLAPGLVATGLRGALWSESECCVDPREAVAKLSAWLSTRPGVVARRGVTATVAGELRSGGHGVGLADGTEYAATHVVVCPGEDLDTLFPKALGAAPLTRCKLQMLRTAPQPRAWRVGPMLAAGSTLRHYSSFAACPSLPQVRARFSAERPLFDRFGIHVMASQNGLGEVILGDSHEYGESFAPDLLAEIDEAILSYLATFVTLPDARPAARWSGVYAKRTDGGTEQVLAPSESVRVVTGIGGAGMTLSFGLAEEVMKELLAEL